jgi:hypothetical protein
MTKGIYEMAKAFVNGFGDDDAYNLATEILQVLYNKKYCIWQTYTMKDIKISTGKKVITREMFDDLQDQLMNTFSNGYLTY